MADAYDLLVRRLILEASNPNARGRRVPPARSPDLVAARYQADLRRLVDQLEVALFRNLPLLRADTRLDASSDEVVGQVMGEIAVIYQREVQRTWDTAARSVSEHNRREMDRQWQAVMGIDYPEQGDPLRESLEASRAANVALITRMTEEQLTLIRDELRKMGPGARVEDIARMLRTRMGVTRSRAALIARDQVLKLNSQLTQKRHEQAGVDQYEWVASMDERTRQSTDKSEDSYNKWQDHRALHGTIHRWDQPPVVNKKNGDRAHPGEYFQCRCTANPVFDLKSMEAPPQPVGPVSILRPTQPLVLTPTVPRSTVSAKVSGPRQWERLRDAVLAQGLWFGGLTSYGSSKAWVVRVSENGPGLMSGTAVPVRRPDFVRNLRWFKGVMNEAGADSVIRMQRAAAAAGILIPEPT